MDYYVIQAYSNCEKKVKAALEERIEMSGLSKMFGEIMIPTEQVTELKKGQKKTNGKKVLPWLYACSNGNE
jgi:transcriptional antiterminator NusG